MPSRRAVLKALGWSAAGLTAVAAGGAAAFPALPYRKDPTADDAAGWVSLRPDGAIELASPRVEMGQGIAVGLRQIVADELDQPLAAVRCHGPDSARIAPVRATVGSDSMRDFAEPLARAAAALAAAVRARAAARLGVDPDRVTLQDGAAVSAGGAAIPLAELAAGPAMLIDGDAVARAVPRFATPAARQVGAPRATDRIVDLVTAAAPLYAQDVRLPGLLHAAVLRPDAVVGEIVAVDDSACRSIPGYVGLFRAGRHQALVAERRGALGRALATVRIEERGEATISSASLAQAVDVDAGLAGGALEHSLHDDAMADDARWDVDLRLELPPAAHVAMEPRTAVARFDDAGRLEVWTGSQDVFFARAVLADALHLDADEVLVHGMRVGGGFGGKTICTVELEAAQLARATGRPVRVQWSRRDEFRAAFHRPPSSHRIRASLTEDGRIADWWHAFRSGHVIFTNAAMGPLLQFATSFVADPGVGRGADVPYAARRKRVEFDDVRMPLKTGPWRGLGALPNGWAVETAVDQLASQAGQDPLAFRLANVAPQHPRLAAVLRRAGEISGWAARPRTPGRGHGIACGIYKEAAFVAVVAEVAVADGAARVTKFWCAHDCGRVINPDQVRAQVEGNLVWGLGSALFEALEIEQGRIVHRSQADYALARFSDVPEMEIALVDSGAAPGGAGETAIIAASAAVTNAIAAATGRVVTRLPYRG